VTSDEGKATAPSGTATAPPPATQPETVAAPPVGRLRAYYDRNEHKIAIAAFIGGFVVDILTVERIDSWFTIGQQVLYLTVITLALMQMFLEQAGPAPVPEGMLVIRRWYHRYRSAILHFFLGTLLNLYAIFFFKSSSLLVSFSFLGVLVLVLIANETPRLKALGLPFKFALLSLCFLSFFALIVPTVIGSLGTAVFLTSILLGCLPLAGLAWWAMSRSPELLPKARRQILVPLGLVLIAYLVSYLYKVTPPVPLSIPFMGIYHFVERTEEGYRLSHERPMWRFWHNGDQHFYAQPGDRVYVFFRIFSPSRFSDQVVVRWYLKKEVTDRWQLQDQIPIKIVGGREQGFRGYGFKTNYQAGYWRVRVETTDGREIGRIHFTLATLPEAPRIFQVDIQ
jgi:hypothetical protein